MTLFLNLKDTKLGLKLNTFKTIIVKLKRIFFQLKSFQLQNFHMEQLNL